MKKIQFGELMRIYQEHCKEEMKVNMEIMEPLRGWNVLYEITEHGTTVILEPDDLCDLQKEGRWDSIKRGGT